MSPYRRASCHAPSDPRLLLPPRSGPSAASSRAAESGPGVTSWRIPRTSLRRQRAPSDQVRLKVTFIVMLATAPGPDPSTDPGVRSPTDHDVHAAVRQGPIFAAGAQQAGPGGEQAGSGPLSVDRVNKSISLQLDKYPGARRSCPMGATGALPGIPRVCSVRVVPSCPPFERTPKETPHMVEGRVRSRGSSPTAASGALPGRPERPSPCGLNPGHPCRNLRLYFTLMTHCPTVPHPGPRGGRRRSEWAWPWFPSAEK